jgi:hypothetical protein
MGNHDRDKQISQLQPVAMQWFADVELGCNVLLDV